MNSGVKELNDTCSQVLVESLSERLKGEIDRLLARGASQAGILSIVEIMAERAAGGNPNRAALTVAAVKAYLETR